MGASNSYPRRILIAVFLLLGLVAQAQTTFTSRHAFGGDDSIDWGTLGATTGTSGTVLSNPFPTTLSTRGLVSVTGVQPLGFFTRVDEGINWHGDFAPGDQLLTTGSNTGPVTITFSKPVFGAGVQLQMLPLGGYIASLTALDSTGTVLASITANATSTDPGLADNSAPFLGVRMPSAQIAKIQVSCIVPARPNVDEVFAMNSIAVATQSSPQINRDYDFDGDGKADILWRNTATGEDVIWQMNGTLLLGGPHLPGVSDPNWQIVGVGDFNADGKSDLLWRNSLTGDNVIWLLNGSSLIAGPQLPSVPDPSWKVAGVADFNGDGRADILWRNSATGANALWIINNDSLAAGALLPTVSDLNWHIAGVADFDGDGHADILWRNSATGANALWLMSGDRLLSGPSLLTVADPNWEIAAVADFNGDGKADILWRNTLTGDNVIWLMNGASLLAGPSLPRVSDLNWHIVGVRDFNGDGQADILWRHSVTGSNVIWLMNGGTIVGSAALSTVTDPNWTVIP